MAIANNQIIYYAPSKLPEVTADGDSGLHINGFNVPISSHTFTNGIGSIEFNADVTVIGVRAFNGCSLITKIILPETLERIGDINSADYSFNGCSGLTSIVIPNNVSIIGRKVFNYCGGLTSITIGANVSQIGLEAFRYCTRLNAFICNCTTPINIANNDVFNNTPINKAVLFVPQSSISTYKNADVWKNFGLITNKTNNKIVYFASSKLPEINWGSGVGIYINSFYNNSTRLTLKTHTFNSGFGELSFSNDITKFEQNAFYYCLNLTNIILPDTLTCLELNCFRGCGLTSIYIGKNITYIDTGCLGGNIYLEKIIVDNENTKYDSRNNCNGIIITSYNSLLIGCKNTIIPEDIIEIKNHCFLDITTLTSIIIPQNVTTIGLAAFGWCTGLTIVYCNAIEPPQCEENNVFCDVDTSKIDLLVPEVSEIKYKNAEVWKDFKFNSIQLSSRFYAINDIAKLKKQDNGYYKEKDRIVAKKDGDDTHYFTYMGVKLKTLDDGAIHNYNKLQCVLRPDMSSVISYIEYRGKFNSKENENSDIENITFGIIEMSSKYMHFKETTATSDDLGDYYAYYSTYVTQIPDWTFCKYYYDYYGIHHYKYNNLYAIKLPKTVKTTGNYSFYKNSNLTSVSLLGTDLKSIGTRCFSESNLTAINLSEQSSLTEINDRAFMSCTSLTSVNLPQSNSLTLIDDAAFMSCITLTSIEIPSTITTIHEYVFSNCSTLNGPQMLTSIKCIDSHAFEYCTSLTHNNSNSYVILTNNVTLIDDYAFHHCTSLTQITLTNNSNYKKIEEHTFSECSDLTNVQYNDNKTNYTDTPILHNNITIIGDSAFANCGSLPNFIFTSNLTTICDSAFYDCYQLRYTSLLTSNSTKKDSYLSSTIQYIDDNAFEKTMLGGESHNNPFIIESKNICGHTFAHVYGPSPDFSIFSYVYLGSQTAEKAVQSTGYRSVDRSSFRGSLIKEFAVHENNATLKSFTDTTHNDYGILFGKNNGKLVCFNIGLEREALNSKNEPYVVPSSVTIIDIEAFAECKYEKLHELNLNTVQDIYTKAFEESTIHFTGFVYKGQDLTFPITLTSIGDSAFNNSNICATDHTLYIPNTILYLGDGVFSSCSQIHEARFIELSEYNTDKDKGVDYIAYNLFNNCSQLTKVAIDDFYSGNANYTGGKPNTIKYIGGCAFNNCTILNSIDMPTTITSIGTMAFYNCQTLPKINIPASVNIIDSDCFRYCNKLKTVYSYFSQDLSSWLNITFNNEYANPLSNGAALYVQNPNGQVSTITSLTMPYNNNIYYVQNYAFYGCTSLKTVTLNNGNMLTIGEKAFTNCALTDVITDNIDNWCGITFSDKTSNPIQYQTNKYLKCKGNVVTSLNLITAVKNYAFYNCKSIKTITFQEGASISVNAFAGCSNVSLITSFANTPPTADEHAFYTTENGIVNMSPDIPIIIPAGTYKAYTEDLDINSGWRYFNKFIDSAYVIKYTGDVNTDAYFRYLINNDKTKFDKIIKIGSTYYALYKVKITEIPQEHFDNCAELESIELPSTLASIGTCAFRNCSNLTAITINNNDEYESAGGILYNKGKNKLIQYPIGKTETSINIIDAVNTIGEYAFYNCTNLEKIVMSSTLTSIGEYAFNGCTNITSITCNRVKAPTCYNNETCFEGIKKYIELNVNDNEYYNKAGWKYFYDFAYYIEYTGNVASSYFNAAANNFGGLTKRFKRQYAVYNTEITQINSDAFKDCSTLKSAILQPSVTNISTTAFLNCSSLTLVTIDNATYKTDNDSIIYKRISSTEASIFYCPCAISSETIYIQENVTIDGNSLKITEIGEYAFAYTKNIREVWPTDYIKSFGSQSFAYSKLTDIDLLSVSASFTTIPFSCFIGSGLTSINIPYHVTHIGARAFYNCIKLQDIYIGDTTHGSSLSEISNGAFNDIAPNYKLYCYAANAPSIDFGCFDDYNPKYFVIQHNETVYYNYLSHNIWKKFFKKVYFNKGSVTNENNIIMWCNTQAWHRVNNATLQMRLYFSPNGENYYPVTFEATGNLKLNTSGATTVVCDITFNGNEPIMYINKDPDYHFYFYATFNKGGERLYLSALHYTSEDGTNIVLSDNYGNNTTDEMKYNQVVNHYDLLISSSNGTSCVQMLEQLNNAATEYKLSLTTKQNNVLYYFNARRYE